MSDFSHVDLSPVKKLHTYITFTPETYTDALQMACINLDLDPEGTDAELEQRLADWREQMFQRALAQWEGEPA